MRTLLLKRTLLAALQLAIISLCLCLPALAQSSAPTPAPTPSNGKTLSENIAGLAQRAGEMIPKLQTELESPLLLVVRDHLNRAGGAHHDVQLRPAVA